MRTTNRSILAVAAAIAILPFALAGCSAPVAPPAAVKTSAPPVEPENTGVPIDASPGFTILIDDGSVLGIEVPDTWTDVDTAPQDPFQQISASPSLQSYYAGIHTTYDTPGMTIISTQSETVTDDEYIQKYATDFGPDCDDGQTDTYDDGRYAGQYLFLPNCGGGADLVVVVAHDYAKTALVILSMVLVSDEDKTTNRDQMLSTFDMLYS